MLFFVWVTFAEHKLIILGGRRGASIDDRLEVIDCGLEELILDDSA